jgi:hypothetical protein
MFKLNLCGTNNRVKQPIVVTVKSSESIQSIVELVYIENSLFFVTQPIPIFGHAIDNLKQISMFFEQVVQNATTWSKTL